MFAAVFAAVLATCDLDPLHQTWLGRSPVTVEQKCLEADGSETAQPHIQAHEHTRTAAPLRGVQILRPRILSTTCNKQQLKPDHDPIPTATPKCCAPSNCLSSAFACSSCSFSDLLSEPLLVG